MRKEIAFTIQNIQGVRVGLFTPDMAFEAITKNQIEKLLSPAVKCVDMVSAELMTAVKNCADGVCECRKLMFLLHFLIHIHVLMLCRKFELIPIKIGFFTNF